MRKEKLMSIRKEPAAWWKNRHSSNNQSTYAADSRELGYSIQMLIKHFLTEHACQARTMYLMIHPFSLVS